MKRRSKDKIKINEHNEILFKLLSTIDDLDTTIEGTIKSEPRIDDEIINRHIREKFPLLGHKYCDGRDDFEKK